MFEAIHAGRPDQRLLSYQYLQMLPQLAQGEANKIFVIPSEFSQALSGLAGKVSQLAPGTPEEPHNGDAAPVRSRQIDQAAARDAEAAARAAEDAGRAAERARTPGPGSGGI